MYEDIFSQLFNSEILYRVTSHDYYIMNVVNTKDTFGFTSRRNCSGFKVIKFRRY
jgi:hypothetical protein